MKDYLEKRREELRKQGGFTLMEMLIVVAIIAVLIAIAIPVFTSQLENSREATDAANIRSAYAEVTSACLTNETDTTKLGADDIEYDTSAKTWTKPVTLTQQQNEWQNTQIKDGKIGEVALSGTTPKASGTCAVQVNTEGELTLTFNEASSNSNP